MFQIQKKLSKIWFKMPIALWEIYGIKYKILFYISKIKYLCQRHVFEILHYTGDTEYLFIMIIKL